jgi:hypothetical protein
MSFLRKVFNGHIRDDFKGEDFVTSSLVSPSILLGLRSFFFLFLLSVYIVEKAMDSVSELGESYRILTSLSWIGTIIYFAVASYASLRCVLDKSFIKALDSQHSIFKWLHWNLYILSINFQPLIVLVYWILLSSGTSDDNAGTITF